MIYTSYKAFAHFSTSSSEVFFYHHFGLIRVSSQVWTWCICSPSPGPTPTTSTTPPTTTRWMSLAQKGRQGGKLGLEIWKDQWGLVMFGGQRDLWDRYYACPRSICKWKNHPSNSFNRTSKNLQPSEIPCHGEQHERRGSIRHGWGFQEVGGDAAREGRLCCNSDRFSIQHSPWSGLHATCNRDKRCPKIQKCYTISTYSIYLSYLIIIYLNHIWDDELLERLKSTKKLRERAAEHWKRPEHIRVIFIEAHKDPNRMAWNLIFAQKDLDFISNSEV